MKTKIYMFIRALIFIAILAVLVSCRAAGETVVNGQKTVETNIRIAPPEINNFPAETKNKTFAKTSVIIRVLAAGSREFVFTEHTVEFRDENSEGFSVYADGKKKSSLKTETNNPEVRTDFLESNGERFFVVVIGSAGAGSCGDAVFAIVKINENLDVNISKTNKPFCQGEFYDLKIESVNNKDDFYRQISIGTIKFNLKTFDWQEKLK